MEETDGGRDGRTAIAADCHFKFLGEESSESEWELIISLQTSWVISQNSTENNYFTSKWYNVA